jgi:hypothetical protein
MIASPRMPAPIIVSRTPIAAAMGPVIANEIGVRLIETSQSRLVSVGEEGRSRGRGDDHSADRRPDHLEHADRERPEDAHPREATQLSRARSSSTSPNTTPSCQAS